MNATLIACGNRKVHGRDGQHHHESVEQVRQCFATGGIPSIEQVRAQHDGWAQDVTARWEAQEMDLLVQEFAEALEAEQTPAAPQEPAEPVLDGIYTVLTTSGHRTLRLRTQGKDDDFAPGQQIIAYLSGPNNTSDYTGFGFVSEGVLRPWKRYQSDTDLIGAARQLLADPRAALEVGHCYRCHRPLTTPESLATGIGPTCAGRG